MTLTLKRKISQKILPETPKMYEKNRPRTCTRKTAPENVRKNRTRKCSRKKKLKKNRPIGDSTPQHLGYGPYTLSSSRSSTAKTAKK